MFRKIVLIFICLTLTLKNDFLHANNSKKVPQEGLISNYGPLQNLWRFYNKYILRHNRKKELLEAIKNNDKEAFKKNFMEGDLVNQTDLVIEIIVNNKLELLRMIDEELNIDIKAIVDKHTAQQKNVAHEIPHRLVDRHGSSAIAMFYFLKNRGIEIDVKNENGNTIAHTIKDKVLFAEVVGKIVDVNTRNNQGETPTFIATKNNDLEKLKMLNAVHADVNIGNNEGITPGHIAASGGCSAACAKIIFENPTLDSKAVTHEGVSIKKTLGTTRYRECIKQTGKIKNKKEFSEYKKRCTQLTTVESYFIHGRLQHLKDKTRQLIEERNRLFERESLLSKQELELREQAIILELENIKKEKDKLEEVFIAKQAELQEPMELIEDLEQNLTQQDPNPSVAEFVKEERNKEKNPDDSH